MANATNGKSSSRWRSVLLGAAVAAALAAITVYIHFEAEKRWSAWDSHPTAFPYLAASVVFFAACTWVVLEGHATVLAAIGNTDRKPWPAITGGIVFAILLGLLSWQGMAGPAALDTVRSMNCYLFADLEGCRTQDQHYQVFNYVAAAGNSTAIGVVVYLGMKCFELTTFARNTDCSGLSLRSYTRALSELLMLASTVLVTATLALYLLFISSAELARNVPPKQEKLADGTTSQIERKRDADAQPITALIECSTPLAARPFECILTAKPAGGTPKAIAPAMGFVAGLSFTGALFFLFMTAGAALEDVIQLEAERARSHSSKPGQFNVKTWLEEQGLLESTRDSVFRGLAVVAPAATGAITFLTG